MRIVSWRWLLAFLLLRLAPAVRHAFARRALNEEVRTQGANAMKRYAFLSVLALGLLALQPLHAQQTKSPQIVQLFRDVVAEPSQCTVRVLAGGKEAALGTILSADGWILTKHSELKGKLTCKLPDGAECDAELVGFDVPFDLAVLKIEAK